ncbi:hypothetical protein [Streptomyces parvulus]
MPASARPAHPAARRPAAPRAAGRTPAADAADAPRSGPAAYRWL